MIFEWVSKMYIRYDGFGWLDRKTRTDETIIKVSRSNITIKGQVIKCFFFLLSEKLYGHLYNIGYDKYFLYRGKKDESKLY